MNTDRAIYWIAIGVLALGLNSQYRQGNFAALHRAAGRADSLLCRMTIRAQQTLAAALVNRSTIPADSFLESANRLDLTSDQADLLRERADRLREKAQGVIMARAEIIQARAEMRRAETGLVRFRTGTRLRLPRVVNRGRTAICSGPSAMVITADEPDPVDIAVDIEP